MSVDVVDLERFKCEDLANCSIVLLLVATYGDGEPTDNAMALDSWLTEHCNAEDSGELEIDIKVGVDW